MKGLWWCRGFLKYLKSVFTEIKVNFELYSEPLSMGFCWLVLVDGVDAIALGCAR